MVNAKKHKRKLSKEELLQDLDINIIKILNDNPEAVVKELTVNNAELNRFYNKMLAKEGSVLGSKQCKQILNYIFRTDYSLEAIKLNYHAIKLEASVIDNVLNLCYEALDIFHKIQELQNINLNKLGLENVIGYEVANSNSSIVEDVEGYENLIRLRTEFRFLNIR